MLPGMWGHPGPGIEPIPLALQGGFLTTGPPGKPYVLLFFFVLLFFYFLFLFFPPSPREAGGRVHAPHTAKAHTTTAR